MSDTISNEKENFDIWEKIEKIIKNKESIILLLLILLALVFIPLKILSYGWTPEDDAKRHVAFAMTDSKWSDILIIDERFDTDHNSGWHQILRFLRKYCGFDEQDLMFFSVAGLFLLLNICGIISSPSPISWCIALLIMLNFDSRIYYRFILGRPYIASCAATLIVLRLWGFKNLKNENFTILNKAWFKYLLTIISLSLGIWIHGSWYIFLLIPISFFIAGEMKDSLKLTVCIIFSTIIGALLTGQFTHFLYYHFTATYSIYSEPTHNWLLVPENASGHHTIIWAVAVALILLLSIKKCNYKLRDLAYDPVFLMVLLCWMGSIWVIRFWLDWGRIALTLWLAYRVKDLIDKSDSLKIPRIRYCLSSFIIVCFVLCFIVDTDGRFTKSALIHQPIDFYNESTLDKLKGWEPQDGGVVYSNSMYCFYQHFYQYPTAKWKYIWGFESAIMKQEDKETLRNIGLNRLDADYAPWINKMTEKDRLILPSKINGYPQLEWTRGNRNWVIGRLKRKSEN